MQFRMATLEDAPVVAAVLGAAAAHLRAKGLGLWSSSEVSESAVSPHISEGLYHIGFEGLQAVGVFRLQAHDPLFWPEIAEGISVFAQAGCTSCKARPAFCPYAVESRGRAGPRKRVLFSPPGLQGRAAETTRGL